jgi:hypothetical protein
MDSLDDSDLELKNDPRHPVTGTAEPIVMLDFDESQLRDFDGDGWSEYVPRGPSRQQAPYVYFDSRTYDQARYPENPTALPGQGIARPYRTTALLARVDVDAVMNPRTYQLISAGEDGDYGADNPAKLFPRGAGYGRGDWDNIANFSHGRPLEDCAP